MENQLKKWLNDYLETYHQTIKKITADLVLPIIFEFANSCKKEKNIFVFGNGGSAANASHFVNDLAKGVAVETGVKIKAISLNENVSLMTAISNDLSYEDVYSKQLENLANPGDLVFIMSVSGNSPNLVKAVNWANKNDVNTIAIVGGKKGRLYELAKQAIVIDSFHYGHVEDIHLFICHLIAYALMENQELLGKPSK
jgi:D-sedoheptulose 7-phosphate isomerase